MCRLLAQAWVCGAEQDAALVLVEPLASCQHQAGSGVQVCSLSGLED